MIKVMNEPKKIKKDKLEPDEALSIIDKWALGYGEAEVHHHEMPDGSFLPSELISSVYDNCDVIQNEVHKQMKAETPPNTENQLKVAVGVLESDYTDYVVDKIIKHSDINNNGNWGQFKNYDWGTE